MGGASAGALPGIALPYRYNCVLGSNTMSTPPEPHFAGGIGPTATGRVPRPGLSWACFRFQERESPRASDASDGTAAFSHRTTTGMPIRGQISHTKIAKTTSSRALAGIPARKNVPEENCLLS